MLIKHLLLLLFSFCSFYLFSQQISSLGNVDIIDSYYNPSFTAFENEQRYSSLCRQLQPRSGVLTEDWRELVVIAETDIDKLNSGLGITLHHEDRFLARTRSAELNYRYSVVLGDHSNIALGIGGGYKDYELDTSGLIFPGGIPENLSQGLQSGVNLNTGVGLTWNDKLYVGASVMQLNNTRLGIFQLERHYTLHGQYMFDLTEKFKLQPQALWLFNKDLNMLRVNVKGYHNNRFWWMLSTGHNIQFMASAGIRLFGNFDIGYGIDLFRHKYTKTFIGVLHEVFLSYRI